MLTLQFSLPLFITLMDFPLFFVLKRKIKERHIRKFTCRNCTALINPRGSKFLYVSCRRSTRQMNFSFPISCSLIALKRHKQIFFMKNQKMSSTFYLSDHQKWHCTMNGNILYIYLRSKLRRIRFQGVQLMNKLNWRSEENVSSQKILMNGYIKWIPQ